MPLVEAMLKDLDVRPKQVLVEATILSCRLNEGMDWGVSIDYNDALFNPGKLNITNSNGLTFNILAEQHFTSFIQALETVTDVTIMANPKILAVNKQLGQVYIGKKIGYREGTTVGVGGVATEGSVKFMDTGTKLAFRPYIGNDGYIRMDIHPKDSSGDLIE